MNKDNILLVENYLSETNQEINYDIEFVYKMYKTLFKDEIETHNFNSKKAQCI